MSRAQRIRQIAEANQTVFSSPASGEWWLAERTARPLPAESATNAKPVLNQLVSQPISHPRPSEAIVGERPLRETGSQLHLVASGQNQGTEPPPPSANALEQHFSSEEVLRNLEDDAAAHAGRTFDDEGDNLAWDAKAGCFVASR